MKTVRLNGKTIRKVHQVRWHPGQLRQSRWIIDAIEFTDGTCLRFMVVEGDDIHGVEGVYPGRRVEGTNE